MSGTAFLAGGVDFSDLQGRDVEPAGQETTQQETSTQDTVQKSTNGEVLAKKRSIGKSPLSRSSSQRELGSRSGSKGSLAKLEQVDLEAGYSYERTEKAEIILQLGNGNYVSCVDDVLTGTVYLRVG